MKSSPLLFILASTFIGIVLGFISAAQQLGATVEIPTSIDQIGAYGFVPTEKTRPLKVKPTETQAEKDSASPSEAPQIEITETVYNFGTMQRGTTFSHDFIVKNIGLKPLQVWIGKTTCKCTLGKVSEDPIASGETIKVHLEWIAKAATGKFRQTATLHSTDPKRPDLELSVVGIVTEPTIINPSQFYFGKISAGSEKSASLRYFAFHQSDFKILSAELQDPNNQDLISVTTTKIKKQDFPNDLIQAGYEIQLTTKPGLPIGKLHDWLKIVTDISSNIENKKTSTIQIPVTGSVEGDITIRGKGWNQEQNIIMLGTLQSKVGKIAKYHLMVRGKYADQTKFSILKVEPNALKITLGSPKLLKETLLNVPFTVEVPPGTPPMVRSQTSLYEDAVVTFGTTHPHASKITFKVRFIVKR